MRPAWSQAFPARPRRKSQRATRRAFVAALMCIAFAGSVKATVAESSDTPLLISPLRPAPIEFRFQSLYSFRGQADGAGPATRLVNIGGEFYGTTRPLDSSASTVFAINPAGVEHPIHRFGLGDVGFLSGDLIEANGTLFGTAGSGGAYDNGAVFRLTTSGSERIVYSFKGGADGSSPYGGLINVNGNLYGTTFGGGVGVANCPYSGGCGTVFVVTDAGVEHVLHRFGIGKDGQFPIGDLVELDGKLYGTTEGGGSNGSGSVFEVTPSGAERVVYSFGRSADGAGPEAGLTVMNGRLYGTTAVGGTAGCGTVFELSVSGQEHVLYNFNTGQSPDGCEPEASLTNVNGVLYGTTYTGTGPYIRGTIFGINTSGEEGLVYGFRIFEGGHPVAGLLDVNGTLYGTTYSGGLYGGGFYDGLYGEGTVFELQL